MLRLIVSVSAAQEGERDSGSADREGEDTNGPEETLRDDEDFSECLCVCV